jgi:hypothetical protein
LAIFFRRMISYTLQGCGEETYSFTGGFLIIFICKFHHFSKFTGTLSKSKPVQLTHRCVYFQMSEYIVKNLSCTKLPNQYSKLIVWKTNTFLAISWKVALNVKHCSPKKVSSNFNYTPLGFSSLAGISRSVFLAAAYIMTVSPLSSVEALRSVILSALYTVKKDYRFSRPQPGCR